MTRLLLAVFAFAFSLHAYAVECTQWKSQFASAFAQTKCSTAADFDSRPWRATKEEAAADYASCMQENFPKWTCPSPNQSQQGNNTFTVKNIGASSWTMNQTSLGCPTGNTSGAGVDYSVNFSSRTGDYCQAPGCTAGTKETKILTVGWARALARSDGAPWQTTDGRNFFGPLAGSTNPADYPMPTGLCDGSCQWTGGTVKGDYWVSMDPGATGLHPIYREAEYTRTAEACTQAQKTPEANPTQPPPACDGFVGTVQGKTTCIGKAAPTSISGNSGGDKGAKGTSAGAGGAPGQAQPGGGVGPNGEKPPAAGDTPGLKDLSGTGRSTSSGTPVPSTTASGTTTTTVRDSSGNVTSTSTSKVEMEVKMCGTAGNPACKIDESGTGDGKGFSGESDGKLRTGWDQLDGAINSIASTADKDTSWSMPSWLSPGQCRPWNLGTLPYIDTVIAVDICHLKPIFDGVMNFIWVVGTFLAILGMMQTVMMGPSKV